MSAEQRCKYLRETCQKLPFMHPICEICINFGKPHRKRTVLCRFKNIKSYRKFRDDKVFRMLEEAMVCHVSYAVRVENLIFGKIYLFVSFYR